jgi:hypothetical protein
VKCTQFRYTNFSISKTFFAKIHNFRKKHFQNIISEINENFNFSKMFVFRISSRNFNRIFWNILQKTQFNLLTSFPAFHAIFHCSWVFFRCTGSGWTRIQVFLAFRIQICQNFLYWFFLGRHPDQMWSIQSSLQLQKPSNSWQQPVVGKLLLKSNCVTLISLLLKEASYF